MPLQLGGSGFRPVQAPSPYESLKAQSAMQAQQQAMQMQLMNMQHQQDAMHDKKAFSGVARFIDMLQAAPVDTNVLYNSIDQGTFAMDPESNRFSHESKQRAWQQYSNDAVNPDYKAFNELWGKARAQYDSKVLQDIEMDMSAGRISSGKFNKVFRDPAFAQYFASSGAPDVVKQQFVEQTGYNPSYRTWGEALNPFSETSEVQEHPIRTGVGTAVTAGLTLPVVGREVHLNRRYQAANDLVKRVNNRVFNAPINPKTNQAYTPHSKAYIAAKNKFAAKQLSDLNKAKNIANQIGDKRLMSKIGKISEKAKSLNLKAGIKGFGLGAGKVAIGVKAGGALGGAVFGETGEAVGSVAGGFGGNWTVKKVAKALASGTSRKALMATLLKVAPKLAARVAASTVATAFPEGISTAVGLAGLAWTLSDVVKALNEAQ